MKKTWEREFQQWWPGITCSIIKGSAAVRRKAFQTPAHVYIINWESLRSHSRLAPYGSVALKKCRDHGGEDPKLRETSCQVHPKELNKFKFGAVIADEIHRAKDPKSQQTRALWGASGDAPIRVALTGTPIANDVTDLWPILHWLDEKEWPTKTRWIDRFVDTMLNAWGGLMVIGIKAQMYDEFYAGLNPRMRRMPEEVVLKFLPPVLYEERQCEMGAKQKKAYKQLLDDMIAELDTGTLTVGSPLTKTTRLLQFASSYAEIETTEGTDEHGFPTTKQKVTLTDPSCKLDTFMDDIEDFGDQQVAVMSVSRQLLELLSARLEKAKIPHGMVTGRQNEDERQQAMDDFQSGKTQFILFTSGAGGTGITLTAARYLCRLQVPYSLVDFKQSMRRVRRIGSERHPNIIVRDYITEGTVDTKVFEALQKKGQSFEEVVRDQEAFLKMLKENDE
jgi:SNF2 family DNA or RNA helicase